MEVPFFRPSISEAEIREVVECLRSPWLTTGPRTKRFEDEFKRFVGARHALAVNSCTAALHLAVEALGLRPGQAVFVPTMTFAATASVVIHQGAVPILVDCDPGTLNIDLEDVLRKIELLRKGQLPCEPTLEVVGIMPVHVAGLMVDMDAVQELAEKLGLWIVEDAAHALPAAYFSRQQNRLRQAGQGTADVTCYSFYATKTITTAEGGLAVTEDATLIERMRIMSLHGLDRDAWRRYYGGRNWDYMVLDAGFKYNMPDLAAALGLQQLARARQLHEMRRQLANRYTRELSNIPGIETPVEPQDRVHSWHLYIVKIEEKEFGVGRNQFIDELRARNIGCSVHWRPLHLHPYYQRMGWRPEHCPKASTTWEKIVTLPLYPDMSKEEQDYVLDSIWDVYRLHHRGRAAA